MVGFLDGGGDWSAVHCCGGGAMERMLLLLGSESCRAYELRHLIYGEHDTRGMAL